MISIARKNQEGQLSLLETILSMSRPLLDWRAQPNLSKTDRVGLTRRVTDGALLLLLVVAAFLLGCLEMFDPDVWWHLRAGQWIWENRTVPSLDPFTFAAGDRPWVDLHWLFQVILAAAFAGGGVPGVILTTSTVCAIVLLVVLTLRDRRWPSPIVAACWLPALLVMSARFSPRPEVFSLLGMALYLTLLLRTDVTPELAWTLPLVQVIWVNTHGLFVLGPIILGAYMAERLTGFRHRFRDAGPAGWPGERRWWIHVGGAAAMVGIACLVNPYGLRGALFPLELFPKITAWGGLYKSSIQEFGDLRDLVRKNGASAAGSIYLRTECFLLWAIPPSFIVPALWLAIRARGGRSALHVGALVLVLTLILASVLGFPAPGTPPWMIHAGRLAPLGLVVLGSVGAAFLVKSSRQAALLALIGGAATAAWIVWLRRHLLELEPGVAAWLEPMGASSSILGCGTALLLLATAGLVLRSGGRLFVMIVAVAFGYLALQAIRNMSLFGLAAGFVLTWNFAGWATDLAALGSPAPLGRRASRVPGLAARVALAGILGLLIFTISSGRFFRATGEPRRLGLRESPLAYAHQAAQFAARPGLPDRALVFDLGQAAVYLFHNGPQRRVFMDGRLEVPGRETFATYIRLENMLNEGRRGWSEPVRRMGEPLILLGHEKEFGAEATLLVDPAWRCIYYDAIASVFVARDKRGLEDRFPEIDFAARHFHDPEWKAIPPEPSGIGEAKALFKLGWTLRLRDGLTGRLPDSIMLSAGDRFRQAIAVDPTAASHWSLLGTSCWNMVGDLKAPPPRPSEPWDPARGMLPAQASFCFRRALDLDPTDAVALSSPLRSLEARDLSNAQQSMAAFDAEGRGFVPDWPTGDRLATTLLHLGRPADARRIWEGATDPPSPAIRLTRIAIARLAELDFQTAQETLESALKHDPDLGEAWFCLALLHVQRGEPKPALAACESGVKQFLTPAQRSSIESFKALIAAPE